MVFLFSLFLIRLILQLVVDKVVNNDRMITLCFRKNLGLLFRANLKVYRYASVLKTSNKTAS